MSVPPPVLVLHAPGTNRDRQAAWACELAGGAPTIGHLVDLIAAPERLDAYRMLVLPGGFSYGDDLGAGRVFALHLRTALGEALARFIQSDRPVLGICNGFQALIKAGLVGPAPTPRPRVTLTHNARRQFECRWVTLQPDPRCVSPIIAALPGPITCPVAHGEGRVAFACPQDLQDAANSGLIALRYVPSPGAADGYPGNPNGSPEHIAALTNARGNVIGLMPHPEDHVVPRQHPRFHRGEGGARGLPLFQAAIRYAAGL